MEIGKRKSRDTQMHQTKIKWHNSLTEASFILKTPYFHPGLLTQCNKTVRLSTVQHKTRKGFWPQVAHGGSARALGLE